MSILHNGCFLNITGIEMKQEKCISIFTSSFFSSAFFISIVLLIFFGSVFSSFFPSFFFFYHCLYSLTILQFWPTRSTGPILILLDKREYPTREEAATSSYLTYSQIYL
jgi:hypothetical protein